MTMRHRGRYTYTFAASLASPADGWFWRAQARCRQWPKRPAKARLEELSVRLSFKYFQNMHEISFEWSSFKRHQLIYDRSAGKLAVAGGTSPRGTERRSPVVNLQAETNSCRRVHRRKCIRSQPNEN